MSMWLKKMVIAVGVAILFCAGAVLVVYLFPGLVVDEEWLETSERIVEIKYALEDYRADHGAYPSQKEGLRALLESPPEDREGPRYFIKQYVLSEESLTDTWGRAVVYEVMEPPDRGCTIYSLGRDGKVGGHGSDEDIEMVCHPEL